MRNIETHKYNEDVETITALLNNARMDERKGHAQVVSERRLNWLRISTNRD